MNGLSRRGFWGVLALCIAAAAGCGGSSSTALTISTSSLATGNVGNPYSAILAATGGTSPYTWTLVSGTIPDGLALSGGGAINGVPTTAGRSTFTLKVTDTSTPVNTAQVTLSLLIGNLQIATTSLPGATLQVPYNVTLQATGGTAPYTWSVSSGALPSGLSLAASTGVISGTPSGGGVATFTIQVSDSETPSVSTTQKYTVSVSPLELLNTSLPNGLQGTAYTFALDAIGGTTPYTWSLVSGSLPGGLSFSASTGTISGTPTGPGTFSFTVNVKDAESPAETATQSYFLTVMPSPAGSCAGTPSGNESLLHGNYAFFVQGFEGGGPGTAVAVAGSFAADGTGKVTGGDADVSDVTGSPHYTVTPYATSPVSMYTVGLDPSGSGNVGCVMLTTSAGTSMAMRFTLGGVSGGVASKGKIIEYDNTSGAGIVASGVLALQDTSAFSASKLSAAYAFGMDGQNLTGSSLAAGGSFSASSSGSISSAFADVNIGGTNSSGLTGGSGSISGISGTDGRGTASFSISSTSFAWTVYIVNASEMYFVSTKAPAGGRALATSHAFTGGNYIVRSTGVVTCGENPCADVNLGLLNLSGTATSGTASGPLWTYNVGAGESLSTVSNGSYTGAATSGRMVFTNTGSNGFVAYLVSPGVDGINGFIVGTDPGTHFGYMTAQAGTTVPAESITYGTSDPRYSAVTVYTGTAKIGATGALTGTQSSSNQSGNLSADQAASRTVSLIANGTGSAGTTGGNNIAVTDGSRLFWFDYGNGAPAVITTAEPQ